ncbi:ovochymase-2-like [Topomyia yanbarensis]|uniref:ovochymase-2-like n=1 Tax=Topomyia yanbarensis TaxID=2498891 RepID=UPI00273C6823|nr:ovochymase-2-like [Topomyia yanbarensis]
MLWSIFLPLVLFGNRGVSLKVPCGKRTEGVEYWPWHVTVFRENADSESPACGGTLLNEKYVITAAHCLYDLAGNRIENWFLKISYGVGATKRIVSVDRVYHPNNFDVDKFESDIAVLKMNTSVQFDQHIAPVCFYKLWNFKPAGNLTIPVLISSTNNVSTVEWTAIYYISCYSVNRHIFDSSYIYNICMGNMLDTYKFQINRGSGILINKDDSWHLVGVLLYTVGPNEVDPTYGGGIEVVPFADWVVRILNGMMISVSEQECNRYKEIEVPPESRTFHPTITLQNKVSSSKNPVCYGTLISERFILTAAICSKLTTKICMQHHFMIVSTYTNFQFHFHPHDTNRQGLALVALNENARNMRYFIHCLWNEDTSMEFLMDLRHEMKSLANVRVKYQPGSAVDVTVDGDNNSLPAMIFTKPGDALSFQRMGENVKYVVGLINKQQGMDESFPIQVINVINYLQWIESTVWPNIKPY